MKKMALAFSIVSFVACSSPQKAAWHESGHSWGESGRQFLRALGTSVNPDETNRKQEWKQVGQDLGEAGKDTGRALSKSIEPPPDSPQKKPQ